MKLVVVGNKTHLATVVDLSLFTCNFRPSKTRPRWKITNCTRENRRGAFPAIIGSANPFSFIAHGPARNALHFSQC